jgi:error-prone DNA polymerase
MEHRREEMRAQHILDSQQLAQAEDGATVVLAGLVTVRQRPSTAKGTIFLLIEDEFGFMNVIVFPHMVKKYHDLVKYAPFLIVQGQFQREGPVMNVIAHRLAELEVTQSLAHQVHNFH